MKKYLVSGYSSSYGACGGIRSAVIKAETEKDASEKARKIFGDDFGRAPGFSNVPRGIKIQETELDDPPELPGHWR